MSLCYWWGDFLSRELWFPHLNPESWSNFDPPSSSRNSLASFCMALHFSYSLVHTRTWQYYFTMLFGFFTIDFGCYGVRLGRHIIYVAQIYKDSKLANLRIYTVGRKNFVPTILDMISIVRDCQASLYNFE